MVDKPKKVLLRNTQSKETQPFDEDHAERILNYPGSGWERVAEDDPAASTGAEVTGNGTGKELPPADNTEKTGEGTGEPATATTSRKASAR